MPMCDTHYNRVRKTGDTRGRSIAGRYRTASGYIKVLARGHALADSAGHAFEHRIVAYQEHGGECPACYWCGCNLDWKAAVVDHLNESKADNRPDNLVVSCNDCNRARGALLPFVEKMRPAALDTFIERIRAHHSAKTAREDGGLGNAQRATG